MPDPEKAKGILYQQKAIRDIYPQKISEAEPKKYGDKK